jgi:hypothetical protein
LSASGPSFGSALKMFGPPVISAPEGSSIRLKEAFRAEFRRNAQLRTERWHYRTYVARGHRMSNLAAQLIFANRDRLEERFTGGEDTRAPGVLFELENEGMKRYFNKALWLPADFTFIGENERGDHVRVHYFPGARVDPPAPATQG